MKYRNCGRITILVILMSFLMTPVYGERLTEGLNSSENSGTRFYSEGEVQVIIKELSEAAEMAIERAAAEAAKAAALASIEREAAAVAEARKWRKSYQQEKAGRVKTAVITGVVCLFGGAVIGTGGILILQGGR
jgi:hypothetical protein